MPLSLRILIAFASSFTPNAIASGDTGLSIEQIAPGIYLHRGAHAALDARTRGDSANLGFIVGKRCVAVIDSGGAVATAQALAISINRVTSLPVCYVINTHVHFDHVLGNRVFVGEASQFVGHQALAEAIAANRDFFAESFAAELGGRGRQADIIAPGVLVDRQLELDLGERTVMLKAESTAHTNADLTVYDAQTGTLFTGDLLFRERLPIIDGSLKGWLAWMDRVMQETYRLVVPGHGPPDRNWPAGAAAQRRYFGLLLDETRAAISKGWFLDQAQEQVAAAELAQWTLTERAHRLNVSRAFRELEWE